MHAMFAITLLIIYPTSGASIEIDKIKIDGVDESIFAKILSLFGFKNADNVINQAVNPIHQINTQLGDNSGKRMAIGPIDIEKETSEIYDFVTTTQCDDIRNLAILTINGYINQHKMHFVKNFASNDAVLYSYVSFTRKCHIDGSSYMRYNYNRPDRIDCMIDTSINGKCYKLANGDFNQPGGMIYDFWIVTNVHDSVKFFNITKIY